MTATDPLPAPKLPEELNPNVEGGLLAEGVALLRQLTQTKRSSWDHYSVFIAALAFALSLVTALVSIYTSKVRDIHDQQAQLSNLIQSVEDNYIKLQKPENAGDAGLRNLITSLVIALQRQAVVTALSLGGNATSAELVEIAEGSESSGDLTDGESLLKLAVANAKTGNEKSLALRRLGTLDIAGWRNSPERRKQGDDAFRESLNIDEEYKELHLIPGIDLYVKIATELDWANALASQDCADARPHFEDALKYVKEADSTPLLIAGERELSMIKVTINSMTMSGRFGPERGGRFGPERACSVIAEPGSAAGASQPSGQPIPASTNQPTTQGAGTSPASPPGQGTAASH